MTVVQNQFTKGTTLITFFPGLQTAAVTGKGQGLSCSLRCMLSLPFRIERICGKATELLQIHGGQNRVQNHFTKGTILITFFTGLQSAAVTGNGQGL